MASMKSGECPTIFFMSCFFMTVHPLSEFASSRRMAFLSCMSMSRSFTFEYPFPEYFLSSSVGSMDISVFMSFCESMYMHCDFRFPYTYLYFSSTDAMLLNGLAFLKNPLNDCPSPFRSYVKLLSCTPHSSSFALTAVIVDRLSSWHAKMSLMCIPCHRHMTRLSPPSNAASHDALRVLSVSICGALYNASMWCVFTMSSPSAFRFQFPARSRERCSSDCDMRFPRYVGSDDSSFTLSASFASMNVADLTKRSFGSPNSLYCGR